MANVSTTLHFHLFVTIILHKLVNKMSLRAIIFIIYNNIIFISYHLLLCYTYHRHHTFELMLQFSLPLVSELYTKICYTPIINKTCTKVNKQYILTLIMKTNNLHLVLILNVLH